MLNAVAGVGKASGWGRPDTEIYADIQRAKDLVREGWKPQPIIGTAHEVAVRLGSTLSEAVFDELFQPFVSLLGPERALSMLIVGHEDELRSQLSTLKERTPEQKTGRTDRPKQSKDEPYWRQFDKPRNYNRTREK